MTELEFLHFPLDINKLPNKWEIVPFGKITNNIQTGFACGRHNTDGNGITHLRPMNITRTGNLDLVNTRFVDPNENSLRLEQGDVLFNNTNSPALVGKTTLIDSNDELAFSNHMTRIRVPDNVIKSFVSKQLHFCQQRGYFLNQCKKHVNQASISRTFLNKCLPFFLPPTKEQKRIADKIEALQTKSNKAKKALETAKPLLDKLRQSILAAAFRGDLTADWRKKNPDVEPASILLERIRVECRKRWEETELAKVKARGKEPKNDKWKARYKEPDPVDISVLPELPEGWCWATIDEIAYVGTGATPNRSNTTYWNNGTIPWVTSGALNDNSVDEPTEYVTENALKETNLTVYPPGTLLLAMYGEGKTRGKCSQLSISATTNQAIAAITIEKNGQELAKLLKYFLVLNYEKTRIAATGGVQPNLNLSIVRKISFPLVPIKEQKVLNDKIEASLVKTESVSTILSQLSNQLSILDQSILSKAFRGELVPQDPNDEPAYQLLDRIKLEKASLEAEKKQKGKVGKKKKIPRKKKATAMAKRKERRPLVEVLQPHASGLSPEELFSQAGFDEHSVDEFYMELKNEVVSGNIIEDRPDQERVILRLNAA